MENHQVRMKFIKKLLYYSRNRHENQFHEDLSDFLAKRISSDFVASLLSKFNKENNHHLLILFDFQNYALFGWQSCKLHDQNYFV